MLLSVLHNNRLACLACKKRGPIGDGPCACTIDGVDITRHSEADYCPLSFYGTADKPQGWDELPKAGEPGAAPAPRHEPHRPVPYAEWPLKVKTLATMRTAGETGVGDTAKRLLSWLGAETMAAAYTKLTGTDCGCADKADRLNTLYPY